MMWYSGHEALGRTGVIHPDDRGAGAGHKEVTGGVEGHAGHRGGVSDRLEGLLGRGLAVVEQLDGEVVRAGGQDGFLGVELETGHLLQEGC